MTLSKMADNLLTNGLPQSPSPMFFRVKEVYCMQPAMFFFGLNFRISLGSRQSSTTSSGQTSHRASNLWAAANLSGPGQTPACNSSSTLPDYNGGHRQNSKPVADGGSGPPAGGLGQDPAATLSMPTAASKMQGNSVSSLF